MVEKVGGISQVENTGSVSTGRNNEALRGSRPNNSRKPVESVQENELSVENLRDELEDKIEDMNNIMEILDERLSFKIHDDTQRMMTRIIDIKTQEVVKEMPPEDMLDLAAKIHEMVGLILDEKV